MKNNTQGSLGEFIMIIIYTIMGIGAAFTIIIEAKFAVRTIIGVIKSVITKSANICSFKRK